MVDLLQLGRFVFKFDSGGYILNDFKIIELHMQGRWRVVLRFRSGHILSRDLSLFWHACRAQQQNAVDRACIDISSSVRTLAETVHPYTIMLYHNFVIEFPECCNFSSLTTTARFIRRLIYKASVNCGTDLCVSQ